MFLFDDLCWGIVIQNLKQFYEAKSQRIIFEIIFSTGLRQTERLAAQTLVKTLCNNLHTVVYKEYTQFVQKQATPSPTFLGVESMAGKYGVFQHRIIPHEAKPTAWEVTST